MLISRRVVLDHYVFVGDAYSLCPSCYSLCDLCEPSDFAQSGFTKDTKRIGTKDTRMQSVFNAAKEETTGKPEKIRRVKRSVLFLLTYHRRLQCEDYSQHP